MFVHRFLRQMWDNFEKCLVMNIHYEDTHQSVFTLKLVYKIKSTPLTSEEQLSTGSIQKTRYSYMQLVEFGAKPNRQRGGSLSIDYLSRLKPTSNKEHKMFCEYFVLCIEYLVFYTF